MQPVREARLRETADGRRLSYTEWGARRGRPVLEFRGLPSSSLGDAIDHTKLASW
ncbi:hypothetical protein [Mycobacterium antarcticum]|uniref:hypothetical protein n=1 Tax=Mycolicibacterium sp. TUM20984 TaxID=3023368 RepID=UPI002392DCC8|nr:hypothetical protein [Mycolicibacterium sp. TUM20984]GLP81526.1 hypothetical protein TUM20984_29460 [Mycolicibacterium sp. TUM20984]